MSHVALRDLTGTPADLALVQDLLERCPGYFRIAIGGHARPDEAARLFDAPPAETRRVWLASLGRTPIGVVRAEAHHPVRGAAAIGLLVVADSHQRRGLGTATCAAVEEALAAEGCTLLRAEVLHGHAAALRFWQRCGYHPVGPEHEAPVLGQEARTRSVEKRLAPA